MERKKLKWDRMLFQNNSFWNQLVCLAIVVWMCEEWEKERHKNKNLAKKANCLFIHEPHDVFIVVVDESVSIYCVMQNCIFAHKRIWCHGLWKVSFNGRRDPFKSPFVKMKSIERKKQNLNWFSIFFFFLFAAYCNDATTV